MKARKKGSNNALTRFVYSFVLVLLLPVAAFTFIYMNYFQKVYQEEILKQARTSLQAAADELQRLETEFFAVAMQNSQVTCTQSAGLKKDYLAREVFSLLTTEVQTNTFLIDISYYNVKIPERVYCQNGSYSPQYYRQYWRGGEEDDVFLDYLESGAEKGWYSYEGMQSPGTHKPCVQYIIKVKGMETQYWVFHVGLDELKKVLELEDAYTELYDEAETRIYPVGEEWEREEDAVELSVTAEGGGLQIVRIFDEEELLSRVRQSRNLFLVSILIIVAAGGMLVAVLSFYNNRPIQELRLLCEKKLEEIPEAMGGLEAFRFTLNKMEERFQTLEKKQQEERLLMKLVYGRDCASEAFQEALKKAGMFLKTELYRVVVVNYAEEAGAAGGSLSTVFPMLLDGEYELHTMPHTGQNVFAGVLGMEKGADERLREHLEKILEKLCENSGREVYIFVGGQCRRLEEIHWSYMQAVKLIPENRKKIRRKVVYAQGNVDKRIKFVYPKLELESLYSGLVSADYHSVCLVTDILLDMIRGDVQNQFAYTALCCDVINTFCRADDELELEDPRWKELLDREGISAFSDVEQLTERIDEIKDCFRELMEKEAEQAEAEEIEPETLATRVITFIDRNSQNPDITVGMVADTFHMSISNLSHQFKALTDRNISDYIAEKKLGYMRELILETDYSVQKIAQMGGYTQTASFIRKFKKHFGMTPLEYREYMKG